MPLRATTGAEDRAHKTIAATVVAAAAVVVVAAAVAKTRRVRVVAIAVAIAVPIVVPTVVVPTVVVPTVVVATLVEFRVAWVGAVGVGTAAGRAVVAMVGVQQGGWLLLLLLVVLLGVVLALLLLLLLLLLPLLLLQLLLFLFLLLLLLALQTFRLLFLQQGILPRLLLGLFPHFLCPCTGFLGLLLPRQKVPRKSTQKKYPQKCKDIVNQSVYMDFTQDNSSDGKKKILEEPT